MTIRKWLPGMAVCLIGLAAPAFGREPLRFDFSASPLEAKMAGATDTAASPATGEAAATGTGLSVLLSRAQPR